MEDECVNRLIFPVRGGNDHIDLHISIRQQMTRGVGSLHGIGEDDLDGGQECLGQGIGYVCQRNLGISELLRTECELRCR